MFTFFFRETTEVPNKIFQFFFQVQEQMRQLEEQIRVLVEESMMRKRRRVDPPVPAAAAISNTPGNINKFLFTFFSREKIVCLQFIL